MSTPFIGQIRVFAFAFAPRDHALCQGQLLAMTQNQALFSLLGTAYGGNGQTTFALPDLRGRIPLGRGGNYGWGTVGGEETHVLGVQEIPNHTHSLVTDGNDKSGTEKAPSPDALLAATSGVQDPNKAFNINIYADNASPTGTLDKNAIAPFGNSEAHDNRMPYVTINYSIALFGLFPSRN